MKANALWFFAVLFAVAGCTAPRVSWERIERGKFVEFGTPAERSLVVAAIHRMSPQAQATVTTIRITSDCPSYAKDKYGNVLEAGHCRWWTRFICVYPDYLDKWTVWHEAAHAFFYALPAWKRADWGSISKEAYGDRSGSFPRDGIITDYGATDYYENFAEWVAWALERCSFGGRAWYVDTNLVDKHDARYLRSLQFLRDCGALSLEDYATLEPFFTPPRK
ncbi:MAG: hypothetical protein Q7R85_00820 [bacterium]|nr:hypothetical protein [bacterium]